MSEKRAILQQSLEPIFEAFAAHVRSEHPSVKVAIGWTANESFLLRGYVSLLTHSDSGEIAVQLDATMMSDAVRIASDICMDSGEILAAMPDLVVPMSAMWSPTSEPLAPWLRAVEAFLRASMPVIAARLPDL